MAKSKNEPAKRRYITAPKKEKLRYMKVLEQFDMNFSMAARNLGITRQTLAKYHSDLWSEYEQLKEGVFDDALTVESSKLMRSVELSIVEGKISGTFDLLIKELDRRLKDPDQAKKIYSKDIIQAINILTPYLAEKKILLGAKGLSQGSGGNHTMFVQNIVNKIMDSSPKQKVINVEAQNDESRTNKI